MTENFFFLAEMMAVKVLYELNKVIILGLLFLYYTVKLFTGLF